MADATCALCGRAEDAHGLGAVLRCAHACGAAVHAQCAYDQARAGGASAVPESDGGKTPCAGAKKKRPLAAVSDTVAEASGAEASLASSGAQGSSLAGGGGAGHCAGTGDAVHDGAVTSVNSANATPSHAIADTVETSNIESSDTKRDTGPPEDSADAQARQLSERETDGSDGETATHTLPAKQKAGAEREASSTKDAPAMPERLMAGDVLFEYECGCKTGAPRLYRIALGWPDAVHAALEHLTRAEDADACVEGVRLFHRRRICAALWGAWRALWPQARPASPAGPWTSAVTAALSAGAGRRFFAGRAVRAERCWALQDGLGASDLRALGAFSGRARIAVVHRGGLVPVESPGESSAAAAPRARRSGPAVFANTDFDRPNPAGAAAVVFSALPTHTSPRMRVAGRVASLPGGGGYCTARATHGIDRPGAWFFEVALAACDSSGAGGESAARVGVAQALAQTEAPAGFDEYGYCVRSRDCALVHCGRVRPRPATAAPGALRPGATVGVLLVLPESPPADDAAARAAHERAYPPLRLGDYAVAMALHGREALLAFFADGAPVPGGVFCPVYAGKYYPAVSLFGAGLAAALNCGPHFAFPPAALGETVPDADGCPVQLPSSFRPVSDLL